MEPPSQPSAAVHRVHARFDPTAAIATYRVEEIMAMPADQLARVAWPLLTNMERSLSMKDVYFTPPIRVSASPRATEAAFAAGIQSCMAELTESLSQTNCGELPLSTARLRAAAFAYFISASPAPRRALQASSPRGAAGASCSGTHATEAVAQHLRKEGHASFPPALSLSADVFEFAIQSLGDASERELRDITSGGGSVGTLPNISRPYTDTGAAASPSESASGTAAGASAPCEAAVSTRAASIQLGRNNDNGTADSLGGATAASGAQSPSDSHSNTAATAAATTAAERGKQSSARPSRSSTVKCGNDDVNDRECYERKTRRFLAERVDMQWESVVASVLVSDGGESCSGSGTTSASATSLSSAPPPSAGAGALLRQKMLRTAVMLCRRAPTCAEAGHSFACLLKHSLRAVSATDAIRGADGGAVSTPVLHPPSCLSAYHGQRSPLTPAQKGGPIQPIEKRETHGLVKQSLSLAASPLQPQHTSVAQQQAALWVELVLPLLHLVPLVQWSPDTLTELGQVLETVTATAPAKLVALAQQQHQHGKRAGSCGATGGHVGVYHRPSQGRKGGAAVLAAAVEAPVPAVTSGGGAEEVVNFSVRVPFEIGLPVPPVMTETRLSDLVHDSGGATEKSSNTARRGAGETSATDPAALLAYTSESGPSTGNRYPSYPSSVFHEVSDVRDDDDHMGAAAVTEEMSVAGEEGGEEDESAYTDAEGEYAYDAGSNASTTTSAPSQSRASRASPLNVSASSRDGEDADGAGGAGGVGDGLLFNSAHGDFDDLPCRRRRTQMVELCLPCATRVSVHLTNGVQWDRALRGRDVLLLPLESDANSAESTSSALAGSSTSSTSPGATEALRSSSNSAAVGKEAKKDTRLPVSLHSLKEEHGSDTLTYAGPCRVVIPSLPQDPVYMLPGEVSAQVQLTLDTRWSTEWTVALSSAQRTVAERLLAWMERRVHGSVDQQQPQQRRSRIASSFLLRGGLKGVMGGGASASGSSQAAMADGGSGGSHVPIAAMTTAALAGAAAPATAAAAAPLADPFIQALHEMPTAALQARVRCHTVHADGVRAVLLVIAHMLLQDRTGYLHMDPLTWHSPTWSDAVRRVSLASTTVGGMNSGEHALEVALFVLRNVASGPTASTVSSAQVVDAAIDLFSIPGLTVADVKAALEDRRQFGSTMWVVVDLLTKCSATWRAPRHVALVSEAARRLLLLGCTGPAAAAQNHYAHSSPHRTTGAITAGGLAGASAAPMTTSGSATSPSLLTATAATGHYLSVVSGCGRVTEANLRRGVHALLAQLFRLLRALLHRVQSTQAAPHRFLLEPWEYGAFAAFTVSLMSTPMDATDLQACSPHFAEVVTGLLPAFTRLSRTDSLVLTSETAEQEFLVEVLKYVRGRIPSASSPAGSAGSADGSDSAEFGENETPASREPHILRRYQETASGNTVTYISSMPSVLGDGGGLWDIPQSSASASWTPGHVRVELWNGTSSGFFIGLASADVPLADCTPETDANGIYFIGDGTVQYGDVTRRQRRLPRWRAGDVVELSFVFARGGWDVVMELNGVSLTRLTLPRRDFRLVATNVRTGDYVPGLGHMHVLSVTPVHSRGGKDSGAARRRGVGGTGGHALSSGASSSLSLASAPADVRLSPFARLTLFGVSLLLELVLHYLVLRSSRHVRAAAAAAGTAASSTAAGHGEGLSLVQACTIPLQHSVQQLVQLLHELDSTDSSGAGGADDGAMYHVKHTAAKHVTNAMLLDLVVTLSIAVPASPALFATHIDVLIAVAECAAVARKTRSVALSALYNAISQRASAAGCDTAPASLPSAPAATSAAAPVSASAVQRLWAACHQLASATPGYQPRFNSSSVPSSCVTVFAGGRRIEHNQAGTTSGSGGGAASSNVRSISYACNPVDLADPNTPDVVRVSVRLQRGFQCETLGRYYYFGLAEINAPPMVTPLDGNGELILYPGERSKQRRVYYISDYLTEVPGTAVQRWDTERAENYLNPDTGIVFGSGDVMTAVVYVKERCIGFERNGLPLNILHRRIPASVRHIFPFVELYNRDSRAKWMYPPDEAVVSARYTMRAMLLSWTPLVLPLVKEHLSITTAAASGAPDRDVTLGVLGADGDEMQMVYVAPPQLDQPGGGTTSVHVERFEGGMVVVSDEAGSIQRVCAAALEPDSTKDAYSLPALAAVRACVQACVPELAAVAAECLAGLKRTSPTPLATSPRSFSYTEEHSDDEARRHALLTHPATLLRTLRLIFSLHSSLPGKGSSGSNGGSNPPSTDSCIGAGGSNVSGPVSGIPTTPPSTTLPAAADKAIHALLPLLDAVLPAAQLNLPPHVLLRESWNELWCNPHLRERLLIRVLQANAPEAGATGAASAYTEPAGTTALTSVKRLEDRLVGHRRRGHALLCPTCGERWSACTARHSAPSSWCDLLDRVLRRLQEQLAHPEDQPASPYCSWYTEWTDGPLTAISHATGAGGLPQSVPAAATAAAAAVAGVENEVGAGGEGYHSRTSPQSSDAMLWEDADDEDGDDAASEAAAADGHGEPAVEAEEDADSGDAAAPGDDYSVASGAEAMTSELVGPPRVEDSDEDNQDEEDEEDEEDFGVSAPAATSAARESLAVAGAGGEREAEAPMTLTIRRVQNDAIEEDDRALVEGFGETKEASFTFTGYLVSSAVLHGRMEFDRINLPDGDGPDGAASQEWACSMCTFINEPSAVRCAICSNARPGASWTCPMCSFAYNALAAATCVTCGCMRPSSVRRQEATGLCCYCTECHQREYARDFHALRHRHFCSSCARVTRWLPKDRFSTTIEARLTGDGATLEFQWALDGSKIICFGLQNRAYNADVLWGLVEAAAQQIGSCAAAEVGRYVCPIPERPLTSHLAKPQERITASAAPAPVEPCIVGAIVHYASAILLRYAALLPSSQLSQPGFLRRIHVCSTDWLESWSQFPASTVTPIFFQCLQMLQDGIREPELVSTIASVALALIRQQPLELAAEKDALLYALCLNVVRHGDTAQRKASYECLSALMEENACARLNVQPLVQVLSMEPLVEGQQRATVLALLHHASMRTTSAIAKASACLARTVVAMEQRRPLPPMLGKPFPHVVALTETRLNEAGELLVGQVRGSVGVAPTKGGKFYYEVEVPPDFADRSRTVVMGWGTLEHERIASAQHVGSDLHSWGYNCREHLRLMMTEQAMPVPRRPSAGDVIGSMIDLEAMMVCWTINGQEISWVSVPAQGDGEEIYPYVSASVEPHSLKIRLGNTQFKPAGYQDYSPPSDKQLWGRDDEKSDGGNDANDAQVGAAEALPQTYEFYQQLSRALEEASITSLRESSVLPLLDAARAHSVLRQYPLLMEVVGSATVGDREERLAAPVNIHGLLLYIQQLRCVQELTIIVARHLWLIEKSPYLMSCYRKATDLLFSSGRWTIFELQPGGRPKYNGGHALRVLVSLRKANQVRAEADAAWIAEHSALLPSPSPALSPLSLPSRQNSHADAAAVLAAVPPLVDGTRQTGEAAAARSPFAEEAPAAFPHDVHDAGEDDDAEDDTDDLVGDMEDEDEDAEEDEGDVLSMHAGSSGNERRNSLRDVFGDASSLSPEERRLRCSVTGQLFTQLEKTRVYQRARMFAVQLEGTLALDAGGVTRTIMSMIGDEVSYRFIRGVRVDPLLPLFQLCSHSTIFTVVPNMSALYASEAADDGAEGSVLRRMFEWLGKIMGNMVLCGTLKASFDFPQMLWKTLTFQEDTITLADYAHDIDDNIIAALEDEEFVLSDDFFASLPEHVRASPALLRSLQGGGAGAMDGAAAPFAARPLRPYACMTPGVSMHDMSHLVLEELEDMAASAEAAEVNRRRALAQEALLHQYDPAFLAIRAGLTSVVPATSLRSVRWEDLRARVCGTGAASSEHVIAELDMSPLSLSMRAMLTEVLNGFTESQLARFLLFCSGQSRIPLPEKVLVECGDEPGRLPTAHTCSPISLLLQPCTAAADLQRSLETCLNHAAEFGFV
ncbi:Zn-finger_in_Ran_binding_protein_and_others/SPRY_domain/HECT-domain_(ubiquitin-transferase)_-_putative [Leishmania infantum]|uniref:Zn-finger_in_Ran_binding_protein_and_others/SPRY_domain/HECT-domain_(Ubiquitin-transferase)_-_putative n=1 Tax=Leishmania infantum TaxID=5671 RepID=A0A6L0XSL3_LEIIN|nr:Zn-finger_in_Ran_binding_protein_and_others/SPRY_domain/HECT-domain_(ubiquitin-transferase)_-_putative [Leishmania infantum]SUZ42832.1 Zn-finger_in_Ran_binding_protein_and_others/SPRY_domain/HECT-domain_(ubiquitin-transferase)_-_putative [Leishmania infantum]